MVLEAIGITVGAGVALLGGLWWYGTKLAEGHSKKAALIIENAETKYEEYMEAYFADAYLTQPNETLDIALLVKECFVLIKPDIDALVAHINSESLSGVKVKYVPRYFINIASLLEELAERRNRYGDEPLSFDEIQKLYQAIEDAIKADCIKRKLHFKIK